MCVGHKIDQKKRRMGGLEGLVRFWRENARARAAKVYGDDKRSVNANTQTGQDEQTMLMSKGNYFPLRVEAPSYDPKTCVNTHRCEK